MSMQLAISTNIEKELPRQILFNYDEIKATLAETLKKYNGVVVTVEGLKDAKSTRADLNRFKKALNDSRISIGKAWNAPYEQFKAKVDELIAMVDAPAGAIDEQVKFFEDVEKEEKRAAITEFYAEHVGDLQNLVPLERIWDNKWLNKTVPLADAQNAIYDRLDVVRHDLATIDTMEIQHKDYLLASYTRTLNIGKALDERRIYEEEQNALAKRREEAERQAASAVAPPVPHTDVMQPLPPGIGVFPRHTVMKLSFDVPTEHLNAWKAEMRAVCDKYDVKRGWVDNGN